MNNGLDEQVISYRVIQRQDVFKVVLDKNTIDVKEEINYDSQGDFRSAMNYFASALVGAILYCIKSEAKRTNMIIDDLEVKASFILKNPLTALHVIGYEELPFIESCNIILYMYSDLDKEKTLSFINNCLDICFLYQTLKKAFPISINYVSVL